jgi:hypothetical protein
MASFIGTLGDVMATGPVTLPASTIDGFTVRVGDGHPHHGS